MVWGFANFKIQGQYAIISEDIVYNTLVKFV